MIHNNIIEEQMYKIKQPYVDIFSVFIGVIGFPMTKYQQLR